MKKTLAYAGILMLTAPFAQADALGIYAAIQGWSASVDGGYGAAALDANKEFDLKRADTVTGYVAFEHPIPFIPNIKLRHSSYDTSSDNNAESIDVKSMEYTLYYEILDFDIGSLDLGVSVRNLDGELISGAAGTQKLDVYIPTLYAAASTELPFTGLSAFADINYIGYDGSDVSDWQIGVGYKFVDNLAVDLTAQLGYRATSVELDDVDDIYGELDFEGVYLGVEAHF